LVGFSPLIAITTSDARRPRFDDDYEHDLQFSYTGSALNYPADANFVIGFLDSGANVDLAAGSFAETLGLTGSYLTDNTITIGGVGDPISAVVSQPIAFFAAGLSAVDPSGALDLNAVVGHSNVSIVVAPPVDCGTGEVLTAVIGTPFMAFYNSVVRVDTPRAVTIGGETFTAPDVQIQTPFDELPFFAHAIAMEFGGEFPVVTTASYWPNLFDLEDQETPLIPTALSLAAGLIPTGGGFFSTILVREGEEGGDNPAQPMRVLVDTGAQSSIMSRRMAANLSFPLDPDFTVDVCGVGGLVEGVAGYYVDYVKINAWGGALQFSKAPFVVLDLLSPEGGILDGILGMNFFWNRNVIFEPALGSSGFFHVSDAVPFAYGDFDVDLDVDAADAADFTSCVSGPALGALQPICDHIDSDDDGDVDLDDFRWLQLCFSAAGIEADPYCGP
jgi:acetyltransferase-like isoleucine patch superfamily enzyme